MAIYEFQAKDSEGKTVSGTLTSSDDSAAMAELTSRGLWVASLVETSSATSLSSEIRLFSFVSAETLNTFLLQLSIMIKCGVSLAEALQSLEQTETSTVFKQALSDVRLDVAAGKSFSEALSRHPEIFDRFMIAMVRIGETGGVLEEVLAKLASTSKRRLSLRNQILGSLAYPMLLLCVATLVVTVLVVFAVPKFAVLFESAKVELPVTTRALIAGSKLIEEHIRLVGGLFAAAVVGGILTLFNSTVQCHLGEAAMLLPVLRQVVQKYHVVLISEPLSMLLAAGVPLRELLIAIENTIEMTTPKSVVIKMREHIEREQASSKRSNKIRSFLRWPSSSWRPANAPELSTKCSRKSPSSMTISCRQP
ncbi:MAG TPA: type II secretion system F family protein [Candidatus Ozemobacteraceae bacterium]|nr:type II secretion system F family protein [Candidatus Ozemobacteraceae bacterium]